MCSWTRGLNTVKIIILKRFIDSIHCFFREIHKVIVKFAQNAENIDQPKRFENKGLDSQLNMKLD
jgi:hypothetical protein